jgi:tetratricopeptide (TPR) repeat protein
MAFGPSSNEVRNEQAYSQIGLGQYDRAADTLEGSLKLVPQAPGTWVFKGMAAAGKGDDESALKCFEQAAALRRSAWVLGHLGHALARLGRREETEKVITEIGNHSGKQPDHSYHLAVLHAALGHKDQAFQLLDRAYENGSPFLLSLKIDYRLEALRGDFRFKDLVRKLRFE